MSGLHLDMFDLFSFLQKHCETKHKKVVQIFKLPPFLIEFFRYLPVWHVIIQLNYNTWMQNQICMTKIIKKTISISHFGCLNKDLCIN